MMKTPTIHVIFNASRITPNDITTHLFNTTPTLRFSEVGLAMHQLWLLAGSDVSFERTLQEMVDELYRK